VKRSDGSRHTHRELHGERTACRSLTGVLRVAIAIVTVGVFTARGAYPKEHNPCERVSSNSIQGNANKPRQLRQERRVTSDPVSWTQQ